MATATELDLVRADVYITMSGISWETFEGIADRSRGGRVRYDNGELTIMSPSYFHEDYLACLRDLVAAVCEGMGLEATEAGSTTWKNKPGMKGVEADASFWFDVAKRESVEALRDAGVKDIARYPSPDLAIEIDLRSAEPDRLGVYAAVGAVEVWEFDGLAVVVRRLGPGGQYAEADRSIWLPISAGEITRAIAEAPRGNVSRRKWMREFAAGLGT
jgi:Uma2 family endonuclease